MAIRRTYSAGVVAKLGLETGKAKAQKEEAKIKEGLGN